MTTRWKRDLQLPDFQYAIEISNGFRVYRLLQFNWLTQVLSWLTHLRKK